MTPLLRKTLWIATASLVVIVGALTWAKIYLNKTIEDKIASHGALKYKELDIAWLAGNVQIKDAELNLNWAEHSKSFHVFAPQVSVNDISWWKLYFDKKLDINSIQIQSPDLTVVERPLPVTLDSPADTLAKSTKLASDTTSSIAKVLSLDLGSLSLDGGCVEIFRGKSTPEALWVKANEVDIDLQGCSLKLQGDVMKSLDFDNVDVLLNYMALLIQSSPHHFTLQQFHINKQDSVIDLVNLKLDPKVTPNEFFNQASYKRAWYDVTVPFARLIGLQFDRLIDGDLVGRSVKLDDMDMKVRTNQNLQPDPKSYRPLPQEMLRKSPIPIIIDSLVVNNSKLIFENIGPGKTEVGVITFNPINGIFSNVTNDSAQIAVNKIMEVDATGYCQGKYPVYNHFWFDLASPVSAFNFKGRASKIPFPSLNSFIQPCTDVFFEEGTINSISFEAKADKYVARGSLKMDFENFEFALLDKDREKHRILSKVVDFLFVKESNDKSDEDFKAGTIYAKRDVRQSFLTYWWLAIQSGIKTSLLDGFMLDRANKRMEKHSKRYKKGS